MASEEQQVEIRFEAPQDGCFFVKFSTENGRFTDRDRALLEFEWNEEKRRYKSDVCGLVRLNEKLVAGQPLESGETIGWITGPCTHLERLSGMYLVCGTASIGTAFSEEMQREKGSFVTTVHNMPALLIDASVAAERARETRRTLLANRRLILLIDLDLTLIHTTNRPSREEEVGEDVHEFRLKSRPHWTRIRPHTRAFLEHVHSLFECHVVTYGERAYAQKIVELLDPQGRFFHSRILTRNELLSAKHKTGNLSHLFPSGVETVLMIDDRPDVWEHSDALVWVRPYHFFREVEDINAPKNSLKKGQDGERPETSSSVRPPAAPPRQQPEADNVLLRVQWALTEIHARYFAAYQPEGELPDVKTVAAEVRAEVLRGHVLVLSGIVPQNRSTKQHPFYRECIRLGAEVAGRVDERTTILIAAENAAVEPGTAKYKDAQTLGKPIVKPAWLHECSARWECVPTEPFNQPMSERPEIPLKRNKRM